MAVGHREIMIDSVSQIIEIIDDEREKEKKA
jgi:hypothetical protein